MVCARGCQREALSSTVPPVIDLDEVESESEGEMGDLSTAVADASRAAVLGRDFGEVVSRRWVGRGLLCFAPRRAVCGDPGSLQQAAAVGIVWIVLPKRLTVWRCGCVYNQGGRCVGEP